MDTSLRRGRRPAARWIGALGLATVFLSGPASAHDFWVEPGSFLVRAGARVPVRLKVGSKKDVKSVARKPDRILRLEGVAEGTTRPVVGEAEMDPVGSFDTAELEGDVLLVYQSNHAYIELEPAAFESYLEHEGLEAIIEARRARGEAKAPGKESYARSCKTLLTVGSPGEGWGRTLGLPLELVPLADPRRKGQALRFSVLAGGAPLAKARVDLMKLDDLEDAVAATADAKGVVELPARPPGRYLVAVTHMARAKPPVKGDWASDWATFAFEIR